MTLLADYHKLDAACLALETENKRLRAKLAIAMAALEYYGYYAHQDSAKASKALAEIEAMK